MPDFLDPAAAQSLARRLTIIGEFPRFADSFNAIAECLMRWCTGCFEGNRIWTAKDQAEWLVSEFIARCADTGDKWEGIGQLRALYVARFLPLPQNQSWEPSLPPTCDLCSDTGWEVVHGPKGEGVQRCRCKQKIRAAVVCSKCGGKEAILDAVSHKRTPCECLSPERRQQISEWLMQTNTVTA